MIFQWPITEQSELRMWKLFIIFVRTFLILLRSISEFLTDCRNWTPLTFMSAFFHIQMKVLLLSRWNKRRMVSLLWLIIVQWLISKTKQEFCYDSVWHKTSQLVWSFWADKRTSFWSRVQEHGPWLPTWRGQVRFRGQ